MAQGRWQPSLVHPCIRRPPSLTPCTPLVPQGPYEKCIERLLARRLGSPALVPAVGGGGPGWLSWKLGP